MDIPPMNCGAVRALLCHWKYLCPANCHGRGRGLPTLPPRERTLVLFDGGTGLRMSELLALKWRDINFGAREITVTRSIVFQVVGPCKTEASQKPIPLDSYLAEHCENGASIRNIECPMTRSSPVQLAAVDGRIGPSPSCVI
jgi:integrase